MSGREGLPEEVVGFAAAQMAQTIREDQALARGELPERLKDFDGSERVSTEREHELGDVVRLASGSADLTVIGVIPQKGPDSQALCRVMWFEAGKLAEHLVPAVALVKTKVLG